MDVFLRLLYHEAKSGLFAEQDLEIFSYQLLRTFDIRLEQLDELDKSIVTRGLSERPIFPTGPKKGHTSKRHMILSVDKWTDVEAVTRGIWKQQQALEKEHIERPKYLSDSWNRCSIDPVYTSLDTLNYAHTESVSGYIKEALSCLSYLSMKRFFPSTHPLSHATSLGPSLTGLSECDIAPPAVWATLCPGGLPELRATRARVGAHAEDIEAEERVIVDSAGRIGKTCAAVLPGDFLYPFGINYLQEAFVIRPTASKDNARGQDYELIGFACMCQLLRSEYATPHENTFSEHEEAPRDIGISLDPTDVFRLGLWLQHAYQALHLRYRAWHATVTDPPFKQDGPCIRNGIEFRIAG